MVRSVSLVPVLFLFSNFANPLENLGFYCDPPVVNGKEFIRRSARWAKANDLAILVLVSRGKGGHQIVRIGAKQTTVQTGEPKPGNFHAMLKQLGIPKDEF